MNALAPAIVRLKGAFHCTGMLQTQKVPFGRQRSSIRFNLGPGQVIASRPMPARTKPNLALRTVPAFSTRVQNAVENDSAWRAENVRITRIPAAESAEIRPAKNHGKPRFIKRSPAFFACE